MCSEIVLEIVTLNNLMNAEYRNSYQYEIKKKNTFEFFELLMLFWLIVSKITIYKLHTKNNVFFQKKRKKS